MGAEGLATGERAEAAGDFVAAAIAYRSVASHADDRLAGEARFRLGRVLWKQGRFSVALEAFEEARVFAQRADAAELAARVDNGIGAVHYALGDYAAARRAYALAQSRTTDPTMHGKIALNLGVIENILGNLADAKEHYERAHALFTQAGDVASTMLALHNRGMVEADLRLWELADASFLSALELARSTNNPEMIAKTLVNRSEVLVERGALDEAIQHCDQALAIYQNVSDEVGRAEALRWRGRALARAGRHEVAELDASEALRVAIRCGVRLLEAECARDVGVLRNLRGDRPGANKHLRRALQLFIKLGANREIEETRAMLPLRTPHSANHSEREER
jgi:tetratricopeptide (TPR) repeat protein